MRIEFSRAGGFAGLHFTTVTETGGLAPGDRIVVEDLVERSDFFNIAARHHGLLGGDFGYRVRITEGDRRHDVACADDEVPRPLRPLIGWLDDYAREHNEVADPGRL